MTAFPARTAVAVVVLVAVALAAGVLGGATWGWALLCLGLAGLLAHHLWNLARLRRWVAASGSAPVPEGSGAWQEVFDQLYRWQRSEVRQRFQLARSLARSRQAGRALPYGVVILGPDNRIAWCNDSAEAHLGIDSQRDVGQTLTNLVRQPGFLTYLEAGDFSSPVQLTSPRHDRLILSALIVPYVDSQRMLLTRDITQATRLDTMRRDFVANVSHELRTPLTVLAGFLETVRELKLDPERTRDYMNLMMEQSKRMQRIIDDLLILSTLESAPEPPTDERVDMELLLGRINSEAQALSAGRHRVTLDMQPGQDLLGAESELASAFGNLVSNAVRYTPTGGEVRMVWRASASGAQFSVEDTGIGIAPDHVPRLTERFYRVDRGRSRESGGTGLGLAIVKHALMRHQGTLDVHSEPGRGSRFTATFPAKRVVPAVARARNGMSA